MPENFTPFLEKGFFAALGLLGTVILTAVGMHTKADREFRRDAFKRMNTIEKEMNKKHAHILENYPSKDDFNRLEDAVTAGFGDINKHFISESKKG